MNSILFIPLILFLLVEGSRLGLITWGMHKAVKQTLRFAVTNQYEPRFCSTGCNDIEDEYQARLLTQKDLLINEMKKIPFGLGDSPKSWTSVTCSDRQGFTYNSTIQQCFPAESTGEDGGYVTLNITYTYPLGSSIGLSFLNIPLRVEKTVRNECFRIGCSSSISIEFDRPIPNDFSVTITNESGESVSADCVSEKPGKIHCDENKIIIYYFEPTHKENLVIHWDQETITVDAYPDLKISYPNGPRCTPKCTWGNIYVHIK